MGKREKIVITGGLGYIGTQLCKLYSSENLDKEIVVYDNRFLPGRVKELKAWGIKYEEGSIMEEEKLKKVLEGAKIVFHLAGITDVAYTKTEENDALEELIKKHGTFGSRNVIKYCPKDCKIIFPSTHVVFEGVKETKLDIPEDYTPCPVLTYSSSKYQTEKDLRESDLNYVILRLGSLYGYSEDSTRYKIMPNLFSKIAAQKGTIKLFSGGVQHKSLVSIQDTVRLMKFMAENEGIKRELFHCVNEGVTVKDVANICKEFSPEVKIIETDDKIPNRGYTLSNRKVLTTRFEFKYSLKDAIREMVSMWKDRENKKKELVSVLKGSKAFVDERGGIYNYELPESINWIGWIESKKGSVRANHYHPVQEQKCILIKGRYISVFKDLEDPKSIVETKIINSGDVEIIRPNVAHTMVFLEDSLFLNLVNGEREHENFGKHTIPYELVDESKRKDLMEGCITQCRVCKNEDLKRVASLGYSPLANNLPTGKEEAEEKFPLEMNYCSSCHNCQLSYVVPPHKMFDNYLYVSSTSPVFRKHFENAAENFIEKFGLKEDSLVVDIGSNDGVFLKPLKEKGIKVCGVDPAENICKIANERGIKTIQGYFNRGIADKIKTFYGKADLVTAFNVFAHSDNLKEMTLDSFDLLKENGKFVIEVQYLMDTLKDLTFDNIYHEHVNYWSVTSLKKFFENLNLKILDVEQVDTHGGSIRVFVGREENEIRPSVEEFIQREKNWGMHSFETYKSFERKIWLAKETALKNINKIKSSGKRIVGYGSPAKATTVLNYYGISPSDIDFIIEDNVLKQGRYLPGVKIPIKGKEEIKDNIPEYILILAWNFAEAIKTNNLDLVEKGCKFITLKELEKEELNLLK